MVMAAARQHSEQRKDRTGDTGDSHWGQTGTVRPGLAETFNHLISFLNCSEMHKFYF